MTRIPTGLLGLGCGALLALSACGNGPPPDQGGGGGTGGGDSGIQTVSGQTAAGSPVQATDELKFNPQSRNAKVGDVVEWDGGGVDHNVTFDAGPKQDLPGGGKVQFKFTVAGSFNYQCTIHPGMTGSLTVG